MIEKNILDSLKPTRIATGFYASLIVNTKGRKAPVYLLDFFRQLFEDSNGFFEIRGIFEQTKNKEYWKRFLDDGETIEDGDTIIQLVCTINVEGLTEEEFEEYLNLYIEEDLLFYLIGCDFDMISSFIVYEPPVEYTSLAIKGEYSIVIYSKVLTKQLYGVFLRVFGMSDLRIEEAEDNFKLSGKHSIYNCVTKDNLAKLKGFMKLLNLKYDIK